MTDAKPQWYGALLNDLQGSSSLGMAISGGAVGFSALIINPEVYVGFWTSLVFQLHAALQFLSVGFGVLFFIYRLRSNDAAALVDNARLGDATANDVDRLEVQSHRYARIGRWMIYGQIVLLCAGGTSFLLLMLMHFRRALYP